MKVISILTFFSNLTCAFDAQFQFYVKIKPLTQLKKCNTKNTELILGIKRKFVILHTEQGASFKNKKKNDKR